MFPQATPRATSDDAAAAASPSTARCLVLPRVSRISRPERTRNGGRRASSSEARYRRATFRDSSARAHGRLRPIISFDDAERRFLALGAEAARTLGAERIAIDAAFGRVLAEDVVSPFDLPSFDYSAMDGYAVAFASFGREASGPWTLPVLGESRTGGMPDDLLPGCACRIFTGAPIPRGADAVVMQERVARVGERATFEARPKAGAHIRRRGEDLAQGVVAVARGTRLRAAHVALAATCDRAWVHVARRPLVTILSTGDELRAPGARPDAARDRRSPRATASRSA